MYKTFILKDSNLRLLSGRDLSEQLHKGIDTDKISLLFALIPNTHHKDIQKIQKLVPTMSIMSISITVKLILN